MQLGCKVTVFVLPKVLSGFPLLSKCLPGIACLVLLVCLSHTSYSQLTTRIKGRVIDKDTGEPLPFVNVSFVGTTNGTVTDTNGNFYLTTDQATDKLKASFVGYTDQVVAIKIGASQEVVFYLQETGLELQNVTVTDKRLRYKNRGNPAVELIQKVIDNRDQNRQENLDYYEYNKYEKIEFDFNNITDKFRNRKMMKNFQLIFDYVDTSRLNGKTFLPIFLRETSSDVYYRKDPRRLVEYRQGHKMTGFEQYFDTQGLSFLVDKMYQQVDIYDNNINVLTQKFVSPISALAPLTYKYFIADTLDVQEERLIKVSFIPRNENNLAFIGNLYVTTNGDFAVRKVSMKISQKTNLNYVEDLLVEQEFDKTENGAYVIKTDHINMDFNLPGGGEMGMFGKRTVSFSNRKYGIQRPDSIYSGIESVIEIKENESRDSLFWKEARHEKLSRSERGIYEMTAQVEELPAFKRIMDVMTLALFGYIDIGGYSLGPVNAFYSWNEIEGFRARLGGRTNQEFSDKWQLEAYGAYGFRDEEFKYSGNLTYFFTDNPLNALKATYQKEIRNPGEDLMFVIEDNVLLSLKRGQNDKKIYTDRYEFEYFRELKDGVSYNLGVKHQGLQPGGVLSFMPGLVDTSLKTMEQRCEQEINTSEVKAHFRFALNEQYYQARRFRVPIYNKYPIFTVDYSHGFNDVFYSDYSFDMLKVSVFKRTYVPPFGFFHVDLIGTQVWGTLPYPLLTIPRANQSFSYQPENFNLMNFLEFISDHQLDFQFAHHFNGYILNKIPLIKKLKLRSVVTFKALFGGLRAENDPNLNPDLPPFPRHSDGAQATFALGGTPYMEASVGISNIFKFLRLDLVKRLSYLDRPGIPDGFNVRGRVRVEF